MKVLLLHPEDRLERYADLQDWGLVVDLARAPVSTYGSWSRLAGCRVISLFDTANWENDLHRTREILQLGMGAMVDARGIDWWDVLSILIVPDLLRILQVGRVASQLPVGCELFTTRSHVLAEALRTAVRGSLVNLESRGSIGVRRLRHYRDVARSLDRSQMVQVMQDKFDPHHRLRSRISGQRMRPTEPVVLLPSAYVNVSRTAVAYAKVLPEQAFLLVTARDTARLHDLPANVRMISLDPYFRPNDPGEVEELQARWQELKSKLIVSAKEFELANSAGLLQA